MTRMTGSGTRTGEVDRGKVLSASSIIGDEVANRQEENLGSISDIMLDTQSGEIRYAVLSAGGFLGIGDKLFAIPWEALQLDKTEHRFLLDVDAERLKNAPGFDKDNWPDMADPTWVDSVHSYYGSSSYGSSTSPGSTPGGRSRI
jgi:sporulation protein YlmC with PRC-barrel domain